MSPGTLRARWLGTVRYRDGHALQRGLWEHGAGDWLLLLEHPHVYTMGVRANTIRTAYKVARQLVLEIAAK